MKNTFLISFLLWCMVSPLVLLGQDDSFFSIERRLVGPELYDELPNDTVWVANVVIGDSLAAWRMRRADISGRWTSYIPTMKEIRSMEPCIRASYPQLISFTKDWGFGPWNLTKPDCYTRYFRQYMFLMDQQGRKILYLCCLSFDILKVFNRGNMDVRESPLYVHDGGDNFWQAIYDVEKKQVLWVKVNTPR